MTRSRLAPQRFEKVLVDPMLCEIPGQIAGRGENVGPLTRPFFDAALLFAI